MRISTTLIHFDPSINCLGPASMWSTRRRARQQPLCQLICLTSAAANAAQTDEDAALRGQRPRRACKAFVSALRAKAAFLYHPVQMPACTGTSVIESDL